MINFGGVPANSVLPIMFGTYGKTNGESITLTGLAVTDIEVYKGTSVTQRSSDAGYALIDTDGIDIDGITGIHGFSIDLGDNTDAGFYAVGSFYNVVVSAVTVDSQTVNFIAATFRIIAAEGVTGKAKVDVDAFGGTAGTFASGIPEVKVASIANNAITAASINADAITDAKVASDVTIASVTGAVGSVTGNVGGNVTGSVGSIATGGISAASFAAGAIDAAAIAADAIGSSELAASAITEIQSGLSTLDAAGIRTAVGLASANLDTQLSTIDDFLDTEVAAIKAKTDSLTFTVAGKVDSNPTAINGDATSAANLAKTTRAIGRGTVGSASTTTSIVTSAFTPNGGAADQFKGRIITFDADTTTAALRGQSTDITASSNAAAPVFTVTALTTAPSSGDTFSVT